ncbi:hypothetical protein [Microbacterium sp. 179-I 3D3 NHS]|uniref:hypothetical protein n=1 Tax=Microbacterium sp. 179-I 3D3 NHS TaxID=3142382 RepID=UPI0039A16477
MRHRSALPKELGQTFALSDAADLGVSRWRQDSADLARPFPGVRSIEVPLSFRAVAECYSRRIRGGHRFCGVTAARIWGLPVPWRWTADEPLEVAVPEDSAPPSIRGVRGRRLRHDRGALMRVAGLPVLDPIATLFTLAPRLTPVQAAVVVDALITSSDHYPGLDPRRPLATLPEIARDIASWERFEGIATIRAAQDWARAGVDSPKETETRLLIVGAGMPEPVVQYEVRDRGYKVATVDLAYPQWKIAMEYEGDGHRTDRDQWREDIRRQRALEELGWTVIRLTQVDLGRGRASFLARLERLLTARSGR